MKFKEFLSFFVSYAKESIASAVFDNISGEEKKKQLDEKMVNLAKTTIKTGKFNPFTKWVLQIFIVEHIPDITQIIFDLLKTKIKGLTEQ